MTSSTDIEASVDTWHPPTRVRHRESTSGARTNMNTPPSSGDMELTSFTYGYRVPNMGTFGATLDTR